ncbi:Oxygen sensor protein DosP [Marinibacterium anthonyi]|nr:Oxygen sensor protein DosP [Marinibacterium anthonyi]
MLSRVTRPFDKYRGRVLSIVTGPPILAFLPALTLGAYWLGGETALIAVALAVPFFMALTGMVTHWPPRGLAPRDGVTGLPLRDGFEAVAAQIFHETEISELRSVCFMIEIDDYKQVIDRNGQAIADLVMARTGERLQTAVRAADTVARLGDSRFAICLTPVRQLDLELCIQLAGRLQTAVEEPIPVDGTAIYVTACIGFCPRTRAPAEGPEGWQTAATAALVEAQGVGPSTIRAYSADMHRRKQTRSDLREEAAAALENGQIQPWFQPQISTDTGKVTGFEALARWMHPLHGTIAPATFLPILEDAGLMERLGEVMLFNALTALKAWDAAQCDVPRVGINASQSELRNPRIVDKIRWELDRFDLTPERLCIEILETVVSETPDDIISRNIAGLSAIGCRIDLDDFGTGHASISSLRRFQVSCIKIDRSFVAKADRDPEQQQMIAAILTMAERLRLETLAEGVETVGEHALLAQLGCDHVQGYGIARPMPFGQTLNWISTHTAKLQNTPQIGRHTG